MQLLGMSNCEYRRFEVGNSKLRTCTVACTITRAMLVSHSASTGHYMKKNSYTIYKLYGLNLPSESVIRISTCSRSSELEARPHALRTAPVVLSLEISDNESLGSSTISPLLLPITSVAGWTCVGSISIGSTVPVPVAAIISRLWPSLASRTS